METEVITVLECVTRAQHGSLKKTQKKAKARAQGKTGRKGWGGKEREAAKHRREQRASLADLGAGNAMEQKLPIGGFVESRHLARLPEMRFDKRRFPDETKFFSAEYFRSVYGDGWEAVWCALRFLFRKPSFNLFPS